MFGAAAGAAATAARKQYGGQYCGGTTPRTAVLIARLSSGSRKEMGVVLVHVTAFFFATVRVHQGVRSGYSRVG